MSKLGKKAGMLSALLPLALMGGLDWPDNRIHNGSTRQYNPWDTVHLTKAERKGKSLEELQALRKMKWEEKQDV